MTKVTEPHNTTADDARDATVAAHRTLTVPTPVRDWNCDFGCVVARNQCEATEDGRGRNCDCESMVEAAVAAEHNADTTPQETPAPGIVGNNQVQHGAHTPSTPQACWACAASIVRTAAAFPFVLRRLSKAMI